MKSSKYLNEALNKIKNPKKWTKEYYAVDRNGKPTLSPISASAVCWCAAGAMSAVNHYGDFDLQNKAEKFLDIAVLAYSGLRDSIVGFNDLPETTHTDVVNLFKQAIQLAKNVGE